MRQAVLLVLLLLLMPLSGCFGQTEATPESEIESMYPDIYDRHTLECFP